MYNLTPQHIGRSFACKKCGATLLVTDEGLELAGGGGGGGIGGAGGSEPMVALAEDPTPVRRPTRTGGGAAAVFFQKLWERVKADASTWLFGAGAFFTIICLFFPLLDQAKILSREAELSAGERHERRLNEEMNRRLQGAKGDELAKEKESRDKAFKLWNEVEKPKLADKVDDARDSAKNWTYWYRWGMMWGFLFLAFSSLGYLAPQQTTIRRVVGSIIICAMMLLIFIRFVIESAARGG
jgi:hypothetical protein